MHKIVLEEKYKLQNKLEKKPKEDVQSTELANVDSNGVVVPVLTVSS